MESGNRKCRRRIALIIQYDGTDFNGWQIQNNGRTIQGEIEKAVTVLTKENIRVTASGRTDAGVHAIEQVIHFDLEGNISLERLCIGLNGILPPDVSVKNAYNVSNDFHSRFSAVEREYKYLIYNHPQRSPFMRYRAMWVNHELNAEYLQNVAQFLVGEFDFASFCKKKSAENNTIRRINNISINRINEMIEIIIKGDSFLHNMIRIIVGTMVEMSKNGENPEIIKKIIEMKDREYSGFTAPPYGLYLLKVRFETNLSTMESAFKA